MLEKIASLAPAWALYGFAAFMAFFGVLFIWFPLLGAPMLLLAYFSYLASGIARRKARELAVRRQQGG